MKPTLFIDWDKTLSNSRFWEPWKSSPSLRYDEQRIQEAFSSNPLLISQWMIGNFTVETMITELKKHTGISYQQLLRGLEESCTGMSLVDPEIPQLLQALTTRGYRLVLATDNMDTLSRWTLPALQLTGLFDAVLNSYDVGFLKQHHNTHNPAPFFATYLEKYRLDPQNCYLIDDNLRNHNATQLGISFIHVHESRPIRSILQELLRSPLTI